MFKHHYWWLWLPNSIAKMCLLTYRWAEIIILFRCANGCWFLTKLREILSFNETRIHYYAPVIKEVTVKWRKNGKVPSLKAKCGSQLKRCSWSSFWYFRSNLHINFPHERFIINFAYYGDLLDKAKLSCRQKVRMIMWNLTLPSKYAKN